MRKIHFMMFVLICGLIFCDTGYCASAKDKDKDADKVYIHINLWQRKLYLKDQQDRVLASYRIGPGKIDTPTPIGTFRVIQKSKDWGDGFGTRWLGLNVTWGIYGIHGTNRPEYIGGYVSGGCIRMRNRDVEKLFERVPLGSTVVIDGPIMGHETVTYRILVPGSTGSLVKMVQNRLKAAGLYTGKANGRYDYWTEVAVRKFQKEVGLKVTGHVDFDELQYLGIIE
ncbi:L,D-transpeptidase family protein [Brevibacillus massiliensis]|uniref:L,D-transpeptidase family protein n=1 Tax=Brevibacillus massiliensis TaxID=1118054 RepID=UPI0002E926F7|nr:L,D-transpeptidase family protein [Brevibacillus massiliensis]